VGAFGVRIEFNTMMLDRLKQFATRKRGVVALVLVVAAVAALGWRWRSQAAYSNIYAGDYVGPQTCGKCHDANFRSWKEHPHSKMNTSASDATVRGDFSGARLDFGPGHVIFERQGADFTMAVYEGERLVRRHRVTRTVGSLYMQYYIGQQIFGPEPAGHLTYRLESKLPFAYCYALDRWLPENYLDSTYGAEAKFIDGAFYLNAPPLHNWNTSCMTCHNTYPYVVRLWKQPPPRERVGIWQGGFPEAEIETSLPRQHQGELEVDEWKMRAMQAKELVTLGVSCESCHFGGREHAINRKPIRFVPTSPELAVLRPGSQERVKSNRKDSYIVNSICAQCHNAQLHPYPNGGSAVNSNEAVDMAAGDCASQIKCTDCHNPHRRGPGSGAAINPLQVAACVKCHQKYESPAAAVAHSRHSAGSGVTCLDCHMPRLVAGLDTIVRSHRISSPTNIPMIASGMPNACGLCHLDRSINWTLAEFEKGWGRHMRMKDELLPVYGGSFSAPLGETWLRSSDSFARLAGADGYARSPLVEDATAPLLKALDDPNAFNRTLALISLQKILGRKLSDGEYDLIAPVATRRKQLEALRLSGKLTKELAHRRSSSPLAANVAGSGSGSSSH
jgi:hypothetical protein